MPLSSTLSDQRRVPLALAGVVILIACLDLVGWWGHVPILTSAIPHYATMKPNTAFCLAMLGLAVLARRRQCAADAVRLAGIAALATAGLAGVLGAGSLFEYATGLSLGIDQLLARVPPDAFADPAGRMSLGTALCVLLTSVGLLLLDAIPSISVGSLLAGLLITVSGLVGFVLQAGPLRDVVWFRSLAVHTGLSLFLLQIAALATRPDMQPYAALMQYRRHEGRRRVLLLSVLVAPVLLSLPIIAGKRAHLYDSSFALSLLVVLLLGLQTLVLWVDSMALGRVETRLLENDRESSRILHSIGDAVIVTDADARVVRMNPIAEDLTGWTLSTAKGKTLSEVFPIFSEKTGEACESPAEKVRRFGTIVGLANHTVLRHTAGHFTHIDDSSAPIRNEDGVMTGIVLVFRDVNERKEAEAQLRESDDKLRIALQAAQLGSWELDLETERMECSAVCKASYGRGAEERFEYADLLASIHPDDLQEMQRTFQRAVEEHAVYQAEYRVIWPDNSLHWLIASGQVLRDEQGKPVRVVGVTLDVTERHRAAEALIQSEKLAAVGRLAASIAHEINNPLEAVTNLLYLVHDSAESDEMREYIGLAERELQRVSAITNQTLRFHRQPTAPRAVSSEDLLESVLAMYQGKIVNSRVEVEQQHSASTPVVCFEGEIRQVLSNLIGNAIDAMQPVGGRLLIRSRSATNWSTGQQGILMTVADTGGGMSAKTAARIFEPFYTTKGLAGTGLGLWISHEIVSRHGGTVRLRSSQTPGRSGTVFTVFLPRDTGVAAVQGQGTLQVATGAI